jgi:hypothetical protein
MDQLIQDLGTDTFLNSTTQKQIMDPNAHFFKYKLSALPNEKATGIVQLSTENLLLSTNLGQYVLIKSDSYIVQWRFTGYDSSKQKHSVFPPKELINFYGNEVDS